MPHSAYLPFPPSPEQRLLCAILRREAPPWPAPDDAGFERSFLAACESQGLAPLVHHCLRLTPTWNEWPAAVRESLLHEARMQAAVDMLRERELRAVLSALANANVGTLLLKGAPLAYTHYPEPALRTRCDTDVLVAPSRRDAAMRVLEDLGYRQPNAVTGTLVSYEAFYSKREGQIDHVVDLHWQVNNGQVFAHALSYEEAYARSVPIRPLDASARTLHPPHALLLACMHRAAHLGVDGPEGNRLIWLYDIHLLTGAMTPEEWHEFVRLCVAREMRGVTVDALRHAHEALGTKFPAGAMEQLTATAASELSASYLHADRSQAFLTDLRSLPTWKQRATLLRESLFPPADYMLGKYGTRCRWLLPCLYVWRAAKGALKFTRS